MSSWAERVHRRAADLGIAVTSCGHPGSSAANYPYRLEKVKFGVPLEEVCKNHENIPAPLLVLILKLNKESPNRRDVFRAPGHQGAIKKLIHFLQSGRLVNVENYSVYTIASVLKQFLRKIPNGIFGRTGERELFTIIELDDETEQNERLHVLFTSLPKYTQHLLVLLFGTFRVIASNAAHAGTGMTSEALGVSVAPSFFQSCVSDGKTARMEDVLKFKVATKIMKHIIDKFAQYDLFGRDNYEYYARVTGRILKVQDEWICSFQYPPPPRGKLAQQKYALQHSLEAEKTWLQCQCERWGLLAQEESRSTPALLTSSSSALDNSVLSLGVTPEHSFIESCARLSVSLEGPGLFAMTSSPIPTTRLPGTASTLQLPSDSSKFDFDEDNYADDDADYDDDEDNTDNDDDDNFTPELDISHDDTLDLLNAIDVSELPSKHNTTGGGARQKKLRHSSGSNTSGAAATGATCTKIHKNASARQRQMAHRTFDNSGDLVDGAAGQHGDADDDGDDDDLNMTIVKRRYRQNKKKTTHLRAQQQRRLRSGSKSLDGDASSSTTAANANAQQQLAGGQGAVASAKANIFMLKGGKAVKSSNAAANVAASATKAGMPGVVSTTRTCSRCNRGIRHSSSCSSNSGGNGNGAAATAGGAGNGNAANGSGMTMEELRAVNRYAESTKSLSYLPQVHERQTARMRTRSEWFLGPKDGDDDDEVGLLQLPTTCSNCYLAVQQEQKQQQQYLGGGSTIDMRHFKQRHDHDHHNYTDNDDVKSDDCAAANSGALHLFYKKQQPTMTHQYQLSPHQHQQQHELMDTDESYDANLHSIKSPYLTVQSPPHEQQHASTTTCTPQHMPHGGSGGGGSGFLSPSTSAGGLTLGGAAVNSLGGRRLHLDTNSAGNIRLSNSADSIQQPTRRLAGVVTPTTTAAGTSNTTANTTARRLLINVPRQYPLRSSLRRNKEKQVGNGNGGNGSNHNNNNGTSNGNAAAGADINQAIPLLNKALLPIGNPLPSVRNSIADCCGSNILTPSFLCNTPPKVTTAYKFNSNSSLMDTTDGASAAAVTKSGGGVHTDKVPLIFAKVNMSSISNSLSATSLMAAAANNKDNNVSAEITSHTNTTTTTTTAKLTFRAPRV